MSKLNAKNLVKNFSGRRVVNNVSLEINSGEVVGFLGRNGAGKTTVFQIIVGLIKPDFGKIYVDEEDYTYLPSSLRARKGLVYLPQEHSVFLKATVEENLEMIFQTVKLSYISKIEKKKNLIRDFNLGDILQQPAFTLSGGEKRRLETARALILNPVFLFLDEPFSGIDPLTVTEIQKIILFLKEKGIGVIISDHNVRDTFEVTDRAYIIHEGEVVVSGMPEELSKNKEAKKIFLGENFKLGQEI
ncbi:MAG: LPS export ABC transporter ATP-binding protein [Acidobacteriota bacterium]